MRKKMNIEVVLVNETILQRRLFFSQAVLKSKRHGEDHNCYHLHPARRALTAAATAGVDDHGRLLHDCPDVRQVLGQRMRRRHLLRPLERPM